jgi:hypothetical protein
MVLFHTKPTRSRGMTRSGCAARQREQPDVAALIGEGRQVFHVAIAIEIAGEVGPAQVEEHAFDEEIDELVEQSALQRVVTLDELDGAQDVVLLGTYPLDQSVLCVHDFRFRQ